jgi:hypothetical protein
MNKKEDFENQIEHFSNGGGFVAIGCWLFGMILAIALWSKYGRGSDSSILQFIIAICCNWFYIIYVVIVKMILGS